MRSLRYWERRGLISLEYSAAGELMSLRMISPRPDADKQTFPVPFRGGAGYAGDRDDSDDYEEDTRPAPAVPRLQAMAIPSQHPAPGQNPAAPQFSAPGPNPAMPQFSAPAQAPDRAVSSGSDASEPAGRVTSFRHPDAASVEAFRSSAKRAQLLFVIEQYIGKPLSVNEIGIIYHISEKLHFSDDMIDYLLQYCVDRGKKDFRYIARVAENWAKDGIMTPAQAEIYSAGSAEAGGFGKHPASGRDAAGISGKRADSSTRKTGKKGGRSRSSNVFNQFEQNSYDFDALEEELLSAPDSGPGPQ